MSKKRFEKIKIMDFFYDEAKNLIKLKVQDLETKDEINWGLYESDFDSLINQITKKSLSFSPEQRKKIGKLLVNKEFINISEVDIKKSVSKENIEEYHDILDEYPYWEIMGDIEEITSED